MYGLARSYVDIDKSDCGMRYAHYACGVLHPNKLSVRDVVLASNSSNQKMGLNLPVSEKHLRYLL